MDKKYRVLPSRNRGSDTGYCEDENAPNTFLEASPEDFVLLNENPYLLATNTAAERLIDLTPQHTRDGSRINVWT